MHLIATGGYGAMGKQQYALSADINKLIPLV